MANYPWDDGGGPEYITGSSVPAPGTDGYTELRAAEAAEGLMTSSFFPSYSGYYDFPQWLIDSTVYGLPTTDWILANLSPEQWSHMESLDRKTLKKLLANLTRNWAMTGDIGQLRPGSHPDGGAVSMVTGRTESSFVEGLGWIAIGYMLGYLTGYASVWVGRQVQIAVAGWKGLLYGLLAGAGTGYAVRESMAYLLEETEFDPYGQLAFDVGLTFGAAGLDPLPISTPKVEFDVEFGVYYNPEWLNELGENVEDLLFGPPLIDRIEVQPILIGEWFTPPRVQNTGNEGCIPIWVYREKVSYDPIGDAFDVIWNVLFD